MDTMLSINEPLDDEAESEARSLLSHAVKILDHLNIEIDACRDHTITGPRLCKQRTQVAFAIRRYRTIIAPHRKLPLEILAEIFHYCVYPHVRVESEPFTAPLSSVCRKWRQVALGTPKLWSDVHVDYGQYDDYLLITKLTKKRLSRSGSFLISITIEGDSSRIARGFLKLPSNPIVDLVLPHSHRLRSINLSSLSSWLIPFMELSPTLTTSLEYVKLSYQDDHPFTPTVVTFSTSPLLETLILKSRYHLPIPRLPWDKLVDLSLSTYVDPEMAFSILRNCTRLRYFCLTLGGNPAVADDTSSSYPSTIFLPNLLSLGVKMGGKRFDALFFRILVLPSLVTFRVLGGHHTHVWDPLCNRIVGRSGLIETLEISARVLRSDMEQLLSEVPSLVNLVILMGDAFSRDTLEMMSRGELVPKLRSLSCVVETLEEFLDMIESRLQMGTSAHTSCSVIQSVTTFANAKQYSQACRLRVQKMTTDGLEINFRRK